MCWNDDDVRRNLFFLIPLSVLVSFILCIAFSKGLTVLWAIGMLAMAGSMLLVLSDVCARRKWTVFIFAFQLLVLISSSLLPDSVPSGRVSPRLVLYSVGISVAMCAWMLIGLMSKSSEPDFVLGAYKGRNFILDAMKVEYSMLQQSVLLVVAVTYGTGTAVRTAICISCLVVSAAVSAVIQIRFSSICFLNKKVGTPPPSGMDRDLFRQVTDILEKQKLFLDPDLGIDVLSRHLGTNRSYTSRCINTCTGFSVPRYINNYRVRYAMDLFRNNVSLKVSELATMSGFSNGVTFATAFRLETDMNPRDWCRDVRDSTIKGRVHPSTKEVQEPRQSPSLSLRDVGG